LKLDTIPNNKKTFSIFSTLDILKRKLIYIGKDTIGLLILLAIMAKTIIFMNIIKSNGAAELKFDLSKTTLESLKLYLLFSLILISAAFIFSKGRHVIALLVINLLFTVLLVGDLWYYRGFQDFLSLHLLGETQNLNNLSKAVLAMARPIDIIFIIDNIVFLFLAIKLRKKSNSLDKEKGIFSLLFLIPFIILLTIHLNLDYNGLKYKGKTLFKTSYVPTTSMLNMSPLGYHFFDTVLFVKDAIPEKLNDSEKKEIQQWLDYKNEDLPDNKYKNMFKGKNVIFLQVESLENFVINKNYKGQVLTPNINNLLNNSLYFSDFYEQINTGNSADADLMVNASVLPLRRGSTFFSFPENKYNTLSTLLKGEDYYTRSLHSSDGTIWNIAQALKSFNFDKSMDMKDFDMSKLSYMGITDESFLNQVLNLTDKDKKPFFYYTVTVSSHVPFGVPPGDSNGLNLPKEAGRKNLEDYLQAINYADKQIGAFVKKLDEKGTLKDTTIVIMGDHSGIHKYYDDELTKISKTEPWVNNNYRVPFIVYNKGFKGEEIKTTGAQVDVLPTIAALMGVDEAKYKNTSMGRNLLNTNKSYAILNDGTIVGDKNLSQEDKEHINKSFDISDNIIKTNYIKTLMEQLNPTN